MKRKTSLLEEAVYVLSVKNVIADTVVNSNETDNLRL